MVDVANANLWDILCKVVDNYGDIGVCWRLAVDLASRGHQVRLWVDDPQALHWMAPGATQGLFPGVEVLRWEQAQDRHFVSALAPAGVWVEGFGCDIPEPFVRGRFAHSNGDDPQVADPVWINLEYLSAEPYAQRSHGLPSPILVGPAAGQTRHFFFPGFSERTGGLLREPDLAARQAAFDRRAWLLDWDIPWSGERLVSLFCYESAALAQLLDQLENGGVATRLLVTTGGATAAVRQLRAGLATGTQSSRAGNALSVHFLPQLSQREFDHLLWCCDFNFVRGEDSLVRAIWARKPFVWQAYPQHDDAHHGKLEAMLRLFDAPPSWAAFHCVWNGFGCAPLPALAPDEWARSLTLTQEKLARETDLTTRLLGFVKSVRTDPLAP